MAVTPYKSVRLDKASATAVPHRRLRRLRLGDFAIQRAPKAVRWSFIAFVFAFPFETVSLGFMQGALSLSRLCGYLFFGTYLLHYGPLATKSLPPFGRATFWFFLYALVFLLNGFFVDELYFSTFLVRGFTIIQLVVFLWIASDLLRDEKVNRTVLLSYVAASLLLAIGVIFHLPGFQAELEAGRVSGLGDNPNEVAQHMAVALIILIGVYLYTPHKLLRTKVFLIGATVPLMILMVLTGSRGGVLAFLSGCLLYLLPQWRSKRTATTIMAGAIGIIGVVYMVASNEYVSERWEHAYYEGSLSGREEIFPAAVEMISEQPVFGWHPINWFYELGRRTGHPDGKDAHNLVLALFLELGIVGSIPFFIGYWFCGRAAWNARKGRFGVLPMALLFTVLTAGGSGTTLAWKTQWLVLALQLAAGSLAKNVFSPRHATRVARRPTSLSRVNAY